MRIQTLVSVAVLLTCAACGPGNAGKSSETSSAASQTTVVASGTFDPCTDIDDSTITKMGLDPATRIPSEVAIAFKYPGCTYTSRYKSVSIMVGLGRTFEEQQKRYKDTAQFVSINGREALISLAEDDKTACSTVFRMTGAVLFISQQINTEGRVAGIPGCEYATEMANTVEPSLPKGN